MKRRLNLWKLAVMIGAFSLAADAAMAVLPDPFNFSFATSFLNNIFLAPFTMSGCS